MSEFKFSCLTFWEVRRFLRKRGLYVGCYYLKNQEGDFISSDLTSVGIAYFPEGFCYFGEMQ